MTFYLDGQVLSILQHKNQIIVHSAHDLSLNHKISTFSHSKESPFQLLKEKELEIGSIRAICDYKENLLLGTSEGTLYNLNQELTIDHYMTINEGLTHIAPFQHSLLLTFESGRCQLVQNQQILKEWTADAMGIEKACWRDQSTFITCSQSGILNIFDSRQPEPYLLIESSNREPFSTLYLHPLQPNRLVTGDVYGTLSLFDLRSLNHSKAVGVFTFGGHQKTVTDIKLNPLKKQIISISLDASVSVLNWESMMKEPNYYQQEQSELYQKKSVRGHPLGLTSVCVLEDQQIALVGGQSACLSQILL